MEKIIGSDKRNYQVVLDVDEIEIPAGADEEEVMWHLYKNLLEKSKLEGSIINFVEWR